MLVLNTDQQVNSYFSNQKWNSFVSFCIKYVSPNIKKEIEEQMLYLQQTTKKVERLEKA